MSFWNLFESMNEYVYVIDYETSDLVFMNKKVRDLYGIRHLEDLQDKKCYKVLHNCGKPCVQCRNTDLSLNEFKEWYSYNPVWKKNVAIKDSLMEVQGHLYILEVAIDLDPADWSVSRVESREDLHAIANQVLRSALEAENPDQSIQVVLEFVGRMLGGDRAYVFEENEQGTQDNT